MTRDFLPNQNPNQRLQDAERRDVAFPPGNPRRLLKGETCLDAQGRPCLGLGDGRFTVLAGGVSSDVSAPPPPANSSLTHDRQHDLRSADDHTNFGASGTRGDGMVVDKGIVTTLGTAASVPEASLWERTVGNDVQLSGWLNGHTGIWALNYVTGDVRAGVTDLPDVFWQYDGDGNLFLKEMGG